MTLPDVVPVLLVVVVKLLSVVLRQGLSHVRPSLFEIFHPLQIGLRLGCVPDSFQLRRDLVDERATLVDTKNYLFVIRMKLF